MTSPTDFERLLSRVTSETSLEARWLNTLSLLEHVGSRKIQRSVGESHDDPSILEHAADEARHAAAVKKLSFELGGTDSGYLAKDAALTYFHRVDHDLNDWVRQRVPAHDTEASYLLTTALIERRAMVVYPLYAQVTPHDFVKDEIARIIEEELQHRNQIEKRAKRILQVVPQAWKSLLVQESEFFGAYVDAAWLDVPSADILIAS